MALNKFHIKARDAGLTDAKVQAILDDDSDLEKMVLDLLECFKEMEFDESNICHFDNCNDRIIY